MVELSEYWAQAQEAAAFLRDQGCGSPEIVVQCGSGLAPLIEALWPDGPAGRCHFAEVPHLAPTAVAGHGTELLWGEVPATGEPRQLLVFSGRLHLYEGHSGLAAAFPVAIAKALGCRLFILTNAAGGLNQHFDAGDVMLQRDFINFQGDNPLAHLRTAGHPLPPELEGLTRFADPKPAYDPAASRTMAAQLQQMDLIVQEGVYIAVRGPLYETHAELVMMRSFGADAIGMSTIPELTLCHFFRLPVVGISVITNECFAAEPVTHEKVLQGSLRAAQALGSAIRSFASKWQG